MTENTPTPKPNVDPAVVRDFGREWNKFDQSRLDQAELARSFDAYFAVFPWHRIRADARGFDLGCGSGRWARLVAPRVAELHCIDASAEALAVARRNLRGALNCHFHHATVDQIPLPDESMDFGYSLGVLHHLPETASGLRDCVRKLKMGAPFLVYLYYALDGRPWWFRALWRMADRLRRVVSKLPQSAKLVITTVAAATVYFPLARFARLLEALGVYVERIPLSYYRDKTFYTMRTDALDRFGTRLERRFTREEIGHMMGSAGLADVRFSNSPPYWCAMGLRER
jgi:ubiquinone/menaquinone biosynthesis C-methylase UbiE